MTRAEIVAAAGKLETPHDLLILLNRIKMDELGDKGHPFNMRHLNYFINPARNKKSYKTFKIPLATSLPYKKAKTLVKLAKADEETALDGFLEFFSQYIPSEVLDELTMKDLTTLAKAWSGQTEKEGGQTLGE